MKPFKNKRSLFWLAGVFVVVVGFIVAAIVLPARSFGQRTPHGERAAAKRAQARSRDRVTGCGRPAAKGTGLASRSRVNARVHFSKPTADPIQR